MISDANFPMKGLLNEYLKSFCWKTLSSDFLLDFLFFFGKLVKLCECISVPFLPESWKWKMGSFNSRYLSNTTIFHFHQIVVFHISYIIISYGINSYMIYIYIWSWHFIWQKVYMIWSNSPQKKLKSALPCRPWQKLDGPSSIAGFRVGDELPFGVWKPKGAQPLNKKKQNIICIYIFYI